MDDWTRWTARYGADYQTDVERRQAFAEYVRARTEMLAVFGTATPGLGTCGADDMAAIFGGVTK